MSNLQAYLQRPRGAGERASSVPAHREDQSPGTKPATQWDPWGAALPQGRDLPGTRKNGTSSPRFGCFSSLIFHDAHHLI